MTKNEAVELAVRWWVQQIGNCADGSATLIDPTMQAFLTVGRMSLRQPTTEQIAIFSETLAAGITALLSDAPWDEDNPDRGAGLRIVYVDWSLDKLLNDAVQAAGFNSLLLPFKTMMMINPDRLRVRVGEGGDLTDVLPDLNR